MGARVLFSSDPEVAEILPKIGVFPLWEREDKMLSFYGNYRLNSGYFLKGCKAEGYLRLLSVGQVVYSVYRMILQENEMLFPCNRRLEETVEAAPRKPEGIVELGQRAVATQRDEDVDAFSQAYFQWTTWHFPEDPSLPQARYTQDFEQWWYRPPAAGQRVVSQPQTSMDKLQRRLPAAGGAFLFGPRPVDKKITGCYNFIVWSAQKGGPGKFETVPKEELHCRLCFRQRKAQRRWLPGGAFPDYKRGGPGGRCRR